MMRYGDCGDDHCDGCYGDEDDDDYCVLLKGLSGATDLELIARPEVVCLHFCLLLMLFAIPRISCTCIHQ
uniref:Uncharacterized protein n=1 Tax=Arundo donax TaxID=35708 RepID=A0A0A9A8Q2_ARUDO